MQTQRLSVGIVNIDPVEGEGVGACPSTALEESPAHPRAASQHLGAQYLAQGYLRSTPLQPLQSYHFSLAHLEKKTNKSLTNTFIATETFM